jgi:acyl-CoA reductase-like NAD-dependent aldehyde dehydrogenase
MAGDPTKRDLDAEAEEALEAARSMPSGLEKTEALKRAGLLRKAADAGGISFAKRGRPRK